MIMRKNLFLIYNMPACL